MEYDPRKEYSLDQLSVFNKENHYQSGPPLSQDHWWKLHQADRAIDPDIFYAQDRFRKNESTAPSTQNMLDILTGKVS